jgi:hypothetical protein
MSQQNKHRFAWDDEVQEAKLPEITSEAKEINENIVSFEDALSQISFEDQKTTEEILELARKIPSESDIRRLEKLEETNSKNYESTGHIVVLVHALYKEASVEAGVTQEKVGTVYDWYLNTIRESLIEEDNAFKMTMTGLGSFQISIRCIVGTIYRRLLYSEKMFESIISKEHRHLTYKQKALQRVLSPTHLAYKKGKTKFDLLGYFPEFDNEMFRKTQDFFYVIATKIPKLYERLQRIR